MVLIMMSYVYLCLMELSGFINDDRIKQWFGVTVHICICMFL